MRLKWEYTTKRVHILSLQDVLREYGKWGWELVHVIEMYAEPTLIFKRPEERGYNVTVSVENPSPLGPLLAAEEQSKLDHLAALADQERAVSDAIARLEHEASPTDGVPSASGVC